MKTETKSDPLAKERLKVGAWYSVVYGFDRHLFNVIAIVGNQMLLDNPNWCLSSARWFNVSNFFDEGYHDPIFLSYGKKRRIVGALRKLTDCYGTLYTKPNLY